MKTSRKKPSLLSIHQDNNLKDMLAYYNDKHGQHLPPFEPIYQYQQLATEEVKLPITSCDNFILPIPHSNSQYYSRNNSPKINQENFNQRRSQGRAVYSRQSLSSMNKKLRNIRTSHIRRNSQRANENVDQNYQKMLEEQGLLTAKEMPVGAQDFISKKMIFSPYGQRAVNFMFEDSTHTQERKTASSYQYKRPSTSVNDGKYRTQKDYRVIKRNPHVIYQFESHLKAKRIDDNPKVLGNIIRKKSGQVSKEQLYGYIQGLIKRREK